MVNDIITVNGLVTATVYGADGNVKHQDTFPNTVVTAGLNLIAARMKDGSGDAQMSHMAIGDSSTAVTLADTTLKGTEVDRNALTTSGGVVSGKAITFAATFTGVTSGGIAEAGVFNASSAGTMLCRTVFTAIPLQSSDTLSISWTVTIG